MDKNNALLKLLNGTASEEDVELLKRLLVSGEISIGGNVNNSVLTVGSGNNVQVIQLTAETLDRLNARPMLGNLDRDLMNEEIASGLRRLDKLLPNRAPVLLPHYKEQVGRLRSTLKVEIQSLSEPARKERVEALAAINGVCLEAVDISFNALCLGEEAPKYDARSPFRGLESFRPEDSEFFFGREELTQKLVGKIQAHSFLAVLGASGSGKSSLVMAGMIPALDLDYAIIRPGTNPLDALDSTRGKSLLVADQFEELFTLTRDESTRKEFIARLLDESSRARIILTLRSDFLSEVGAYRTLSAEIQNHLEIVPPMDVNELRRAMEGQAGATGLRFEADLSQQILDDVAGEPGAMPLLQHALWELWNRRHGRNLRASEYRAFGRVKQAITSTAEQVYADCSKPEQEALRDIFLRLTRLDDGDEERDTRRRILLGDLIPSGRDAASITLLLDKLANARLVVKTVNEDKTEVEVAHEALIRHWKRLQSWLNEDRDNLRLRERVSESAKEWDRSGRHESLLNSRWVKLDEALLLAQDSRYRLTEVEQAYLKGCVGLRNREQRERERRLRYTVFASIAAAVIFLVLGSFGLVKSNESNANAQKAESNAGTAQANADIAATAQMNAEEQYKIALSRQLVTQAQSIIAKNDISEPTAVLLAIQSMKLFPLIDSARILQSNHLVLPIISLTHDAGVSSVAFSPDGKYIVSGSSDGTARVWEAATGNEIAHMIHDDEVSTVAFSPDGLYVVSGSWDGIARVWEAATGNEIARMIHDDAVSTVAFSPDGLYVVSGSWDGTARVWEAATGNEIARMTHHDGVISIAINANGKYVVSGSQDSTARVWEAMTGNEIARMTHDGGVDSVAFSPNGKYVVSGGNYGNPWVYGKLRVWEAATGNEIARMTHDNVVSTVAFSPDGRYVVLGSWDGTARVWGVWGAEGGNRVANMTHGDSVSSVAFSPDGKYVVSGSKDGTARVWEAETGNEVARMTHDAGVSSVAFSPNGEYVVSGSSDGTARVWEAVTWNEVARMTHDGEVGPIAFSPDGLYVISGSFDNTELGCGKPRQGTRLLVWFMILL